MNDLRRKWAASSFSRPTNGRRCVISTPDDIRLGGQTHGRASYGGAGSSGWTTGSVKVPRLQILTAAQILDNRRPQVPFGFSEGFKKAAREQADDQHKLL